MPVGIRKREFARGIQTRVQNPGATLAERAQAVERAAGRIGERRYNLALNNCEHFANWCATGVAVSHQVIECVKAFFAAMMAACYSLLVISAARALTTE